MPVSDTEANDLFLALLRVQKLMVAARHLAPRAHDEVDTAAYPVLFSLATQGPVRVSDLSTAIHSEISTVSRQVTLLVGLGLATKAPDPSDGRAHVVELTDGGRTVVADIQASRAAWFQQLLEYWPGEVDTFTHDLRRLGDVLDEHLRARGGIPPMSVALLSSLSTRRAGGPPATTPVHTKEH